MRESETHVVYPRFGDGGPEKPPAPGERINDPDSVVHGFYTQPKCCDCGANAYTKEQGAWRCPSCRKTWKAALAGYDRGRRGKEPELHSHPEAYMRGWDAGRKRWKEAGCSAKGYYGP
ncbi:MAG: hypothetical protein F4Z31_07115 [Gemmatimonadetes bacterium]|nr:hypothetical protein [Gemmatimonadota bacterium]MYE94056.1 hypothetical protein [Gemmatimonadota bacterium]MYJ12167.1 hypothetical protein [Gemmatimonadota bacterium]